MRLLMWFFLSCKRQLKNLFFTAVLLLVPAALYGFSCLENEDSGKIMIALFSEEDQMVPEIISDLLTQDGMFEFYLCDSEQTLKDDVAARKAECGYIFARGLKEKLDGREFKRSIGIYTAPSTIVSGLSQEVVFASMIEAYGQEILKQYLEESGIFTGLDKELLWTELRAGYDKQIRENSTFSFQYETLSARSLEHGMGRIAFPIRGMLAVYLLVVGIFSAVSLIGDERKGLFIALPSGGRILYKLAVLMAPICLAGLSALLVLKITGNHNGMWHEAGILLLYLLMTAVYSCTLKLIVRDPVLLCGLIPAFILASLIICPVFLDISPWLPVLKPVRLLLLPYYYIRMGG